MKRKYSLLLIIVGSFCAALLISCEHYNYWQVDIDVALGPPTLVHIVDKRHTSLNFTIKPSFSLPVHKNYTWELQKVLQSTWVSQLQLFVSDIGSLSSSSRMFVNLIASNFGQKHLVLNWLITAQLVAKEPLQNILVISIDNTLNQLLENHGIPSIHVPPHTILKSVPTKCDPGFPLQMVRLTVMRLLCHWGIDVAHYDSEAVILKNPHKLYNRHPDADVLGGYAEFPPHHFEMWQAALCVGSWMVRSTPATEKFWTEVGKIVARNDQMKINIGLEKMKVTPLSMEYDEHQDWRVLRGRHNFVAKIVPLSNFCRSNFCEKEKQTKYFIWNKGKLKEAGLWFLKENWKSNSKLIGRAWLESVAS